MEATIWSMEAEVSLTLEACTCVLFTMFCTLTLISCMVLVTSSIARGLETDLGGIVRGSGDLVRGAGDLRRSVAHTAHESGKSFDHLGEGVAQSVMAGTRFDLQSQVAAGDGFGNSGHLLEISDHLVEGASQFTDFVIAVQINVVLQIAGIADGTSHIHQVGERLGR